MKKYYLVLSTQTILRGNIPEQNVAGTYDTIEELEADRANATRRWCKENGIQPPQKKKLLPIFATICETE